MLLASGASRVVAEGRIVHVPRLLVDPDADWVAELAELPSNSGDADTLDLTPRKIGNVFNLSTESVEDSPVGQLDAIGRAMVRGCARKADARAFSNSAATATAPAGLLSYTLPASAATAPDIAGIITAVAEIAAEGGSASAAYMNPADIGAVQVAAVTGGYSLSDPTRPSVSQVGGPCSTRCRAWPRVAPWWPMPDSSLWRSGATRAPSSRSTPRGRRTGSAPA